MLLVLTSFTLVCRAQDTPSTYPLHGVVVNSLTHEPIVRALVEAGGNAVLTDSEGRFEFDLPAMTAMAVAARRPGYVATPMTSRMIAVGSGMPDLTLSLTPQAIIAGHITLASGENADGTHIVAYRLRTRRGQHWWERQSAAVTNSEGMFRFTDLQAPAQYLLMTTPAVDRTGASSRRSATSGYSAAFYPEGAELSTDSLLSLSPGQLASVEISLARQAFYPVSIQVKNDAGSTQVSVEIHDQTGLESGFQTQWDAQKRMAQVDLPDGHYYAELTSYGRNQAYGRVEFTVASLPLTGLSAVLLPLMPVPVIVHKDFVATNKVIARSVEGADLPAELVTGGSNPGLNLNLLPADMPGGLMGAIVPVSGSNDPSAFQLQGVIPGRYWVRASPFEGYISSIISGGVDLTKEALTIGPAGTTLPIEVTLRNDGGQIHGTVQTTHAGIPPNAAVAGISAGFAAVSAYPLSSSVAQALQASPGSAGTFDMQNVAPGTYRLMALDYFLDIDNLEPAVLNSYLAKGQTVTVEANGTATVSLDVIAVNESGAEEGH